MPGEIRVGTSGWSYPDWAEIVYPRPSADFDPLAFMARYFDTLEIDSSFYRPPSATTTTAWLARVADQPRFLFTAKLYRRFTHERTQPWSTADVEACGRGLDPLRQAGRLGAMLAQFPWSFRYQPDNRRWLAALARAWADWPLVVEVRHDSWLADEALAFLTDLGVSWCHIDQPEHAHGIRPGVVRTGPIGYVRLHGRNQAHWFADTDKPGDRYNYLYSDRELDEWIARIRQIQQQCDRTYVFTNNHYRGQAPTNALQIRSKLEGRPVPVPERLLRHYPQLKAVALPGAALRQTELF